jgi:hypothetical protein
MRRTTVFKGRVSDNPVSGVNSGAMLWVEEVIGLTG